MAENVKVEKHQSESSANVIRRFTKRMQNSGIVQRMKGERYHTRDKSRNVQRNNRLKKLQKQAEYEKLVKLGKVQDRRRR